MPNYLLVSIDYSVKTVLENDVKHFQPFSVIGAWYGAPGPGSCQLPVMHKHLYPQWWLSIREGIFRDHNHFNIENIFHGPTANEEQGRGLA